MKKISIIGWFLILTGICSCDYLDVVPPNIITDEQAYASESGALAALTRLYVDLPLEDIRFDYKGFGGDAYWGNLESLVGHALNRKSDDAVASEGFTSDMGASWWNYTAIRNINKFIVNIQQTTGMTNDKKKAYEAEAYALRAWCYFAMAKRYGGVPIVDHLLEYTGPESIADLEIPRAGEKETWDFILNDINAALENNIPETAQAGRIGKYAALTLKAQVALYAASIARYNDIDVTDENTGKLVCGIPSAEAENYYQIAYNACDSIIKSGKFELARSVNASNPSENFRLMLIKPGSHKETIFTKYFSYPDYVYSFDNFTVPWGRQNQVGAAPTVDLLEKYEYLDGKPGITNIPAINTYSSEYDDRTDFFAGRDARMLATIMIPGEMFQSKLVDVKYGEIDSNGKEQTSSKYRGIYGMGGDTQTPSSLFRKKHVDDSKEHSLTDADSDQPYILLRYAEVLLIAAEAKVELGKANDAKPYINDIRTRAGLKEIATVTLDEVRRQWDCEMAYENRSLWNFRRWRIHDMLMGTPFRSRGLFPLLDTRTNKWVYKTNYIGSDVIFQKRFYYNAINGDEIRKNPKLVQNYGY
jgi:hypothetical protein